MFAKSEDMASLDVLIEIEGKEVVKTFDDLSEELVQYVMDLQTMANELEAANEFMLNSFYNEVLRKN